MSLCSDLANLTACPSKIPFCCPILTSCIPLTRQNTSVICCPAGQDCMFIEPVACNLALQNAATFPYNTLHTTVLNGTLPGCGDQCCPFGYACVEGICSMLNQTVVSFTSTFVTSMTSKTASTSTVISIIAATSISNSNTASSASSRYPTPAILLGFFGGFIAALVLLILTILIHRKHRQIKRQRYSATLFGGKTPLGVSEPIFTPQSGRTEFLLQPDRDMSPVPTTAVPRTPPYQMTAKRNSGHPPLFTSPLRFGMPLSPSPNSTRRTNDDVKFIEAHRRRLPSTVSEDDKSGSPGSKNSGHQAASQKPDKETTTGESLLAKLGTKSSAGIQNVLMPAPSSKGDVPNGRRFGSTNTTFLQMMEDAGRKRP